MEPAEATLLAIELAGGPSALARSFEPPISHSAVIYWAKRGQIPADRVLDVEGLIDARVTRYDLRPDVFGPRR